MVLAALVLLGAVCAAGLIGFVYYKETHLPPVGEFDTIIVLGAQVKADGTPSGVERHYVDLRIACDERIADSYYFASALKCLKYFLRNPHLLELAPESVEEDVN